MVGQCYLVCTCSCIIISTSPFHVGAETLPPQSQSSDFEINTQFQTLRVKCKGQNIFSRFTHF
jgi:hypothetical protein